MSIVKHMTLAALAFCASTSISSAQTDTNTHRWQLTIDERDFLCGIFCGDDEQEKLAALKPKYHALKDWVEPEVDRIIDWLLELGFQEPKRADAGRPGKITVRSRASRETAEEFATLAAGYTIFNSLSLPTHAFIDPIVLNGRHLFGSADAANENSGSIAHEMVHGVIARRPEQSSDGQYHWLEEGIAEAVAYSWLESERGVADPMSRSGTPNYGDSLIERESQSSGREEYDRGGHFFFVLGNELGHPVRAAYLASAMQASFADGKSGVQWLDRYLKTRGTSLEVAYAEIIEKYATNSRYFDDEDPEIEPKLSIPDITIVTSEPADRKIKEIAAGMFDTRLEFMGGAWEELDDDEKLVVNIIETRDAAAPADLKLLVRADIHYSNARHIEPMLARVGIHFPPYRPRIVNIAKNPTESEAQEFKLWITTAPLTIKVPACIPAGTSQKIVVTAPELTEQEIADTFGSRTYKLEVNAGEIDENLYFTAPKKAQNVTVEAVVRAIDDTLTRVSVGEVKVTKNQCMIRLTAQGSTATYDPVTDITDIRMGGEAMIFSDPYAFAQDDSTWIRLNMKTLGMMGGGVQSFDFFRLGKAMTDKFSWNTLMAAARAQRRNPNAIPAGAGHLTIVDVDCVSGAKSNSGECKGIEIGGGERLLISYNKAKLVSRLNAGGTSMRVEYGTWNIASVPTNFKDCTNIMAGC